VVVTLSRYRYGKKNTQRESCNARNLRQVVEEEVSELRNCIDEINDLLAEISDLSFTVQERLGDLENSITVLEEEV
jgi:hypothetical protein